MLGPIIEVHDRELVNGYDLVDGLLVCHCGSGHYDTIVTVERRVHATLPDGAEGDG